MADWIPSATRARVGSLAGALACMTVAAPGCDFFQELESEPGAETGDTGAGSGETGAAQGECLPGDDYCEDQDLLHSCDPETGEITVVNCAVACGTLVNFTCTGTPLSQHGCWCIEPGAQKIDGCVELESCLAECGSDPFGACGEACFDRTVATTARLYGALLLCAENTCADECLEVPESCGECLSLARAGLYGDCGVERSVCDGDRPDDAWPWP